MVPTFGIFDFIPDGLAKTRIAESEREAYLAEVSPFSTEFGARSESDAGLHNKACLRMALMLSHSR